MSDQYGEPQRTAARVVITGFQPSEKSANHQRGYKKFEITAKNETPKKVKLNIRATKLGNDKHKPK